MSATKNASATSRIRALLAALARYGREARQKETDPALSPPRGGGDRAEWLSDLLSRASQDEPARRGSAPPRDPDGGAPRSIESLDSLAVPRAPDGGTPDSIEPLDSLAVPLDLDDGTPDGIDSLDSLAADIASMIDHDAAADLWDRYERGERNVFTRKLHAMQGQKAFEDIRRKYREDRDFMRTVERYIGEFERLLEEVSRDGRGQVVARSYLTSEIGKIYTMLAHAAGRFG
jgi:hypothetical protein